MPPTPAASICGFIPAAAATGGRPGRAPYSGRERRSSRGISRGDALGLPTRRHRALSRCVPPMPAASICGFYSSSGCVRWQAWACAVDLRGAATAMIGRRAALRRSEALPLRAVRRAQPMSCSQQLRYQQRLHQLAGSGRVARRRSRQRNASRARLHVWRVRWRLLREDERKLEPTARQHQSEDPKRDSRFEEFLEVAKALCNDSETVSSRDMFVASRDKDSETSCCD